MKKLLLLIFLFSLMTPVSYAKRYALVIGNSNYKVGALKNPVNDATDMAALLRDKQFEVTVIKDASKRKMEEGIRRFTDKLYQKNAVGLFYYAGHGIEIGGRNFLIPTNADIKNETDVEYEGVDVGRVLGNMTRAGNNLNMVILDACRDNPYARSFRSSSRGLAKVSVAKGSLILYATSPGDVASDGEGRNGLFTQHLMQAMRQPGLKIEEVFKQTANKVHDATQGDQFPWQSGSILGDFYFSINVTNAKIVVPEVSKLAVKNNRAEILYWESIKTETHPLFFKSYLRKYPQGHYADLAKLKINSTSDDIKSAPRMGQLTIKTSPDDARIRILNISPKYQPGIKLKPGSYHIEISKAGFKRHTEWVELLIGGDKVHSVVLQEIDKVVVAPAPVKAQHANTPKMVNIPAGCFKMGSPKGEKGRDSDERQHQVCIDRFQLATKEVTVAEFRGFIRATGYRTEAERNVKRSGCYAYSSSKNNWAYRKGYYWDKLGFSQNSQHPVACVSWNDVQKYIAWLNKVTAKTYRLPTEAEWEYAARAGSQKSYFWGNNVDAKACQYANINDKNWSDQFPCDDGYKFTAPIGKYRSNDFGLYDMAGNVWEWTCSEYDKSYDGGEKKCLSKNRATGAFLSLRGGSFSSDARRVRSANRAWYNPWEHTGLIGFRLARTY